MSICGQFVALETSKRNSIFCHVFWIMSRVTVSMADVILSCSCWIFLIFSAYTMFLMYRHREKSSGERSGLRGGQGIGPPLPIQASGNLWYKTSVTKQLKRGGAPSCIKITVLRVSCSKVSICGNTYCSSKSRQTTPVMVLSLNPVHLFRWPCISCCVKAWMNTFPLLC